MTREQRGSVELVEVPVRSFNALAGWRRTHVLQQCARRELRTMHDNVLHRQKQLVLPA